MEPSSWARVMVAQRGATIAGESWITVERATESLAVSAAELHRAIERNANAEKEGAIMARVDGVTARELGHLWRLRLDAK